jgi:hypothetical protein
VRFRRLNQFYAWLLSYFWKPCPLCGQMFGGHEWRDIDGKISQVPKPGHPVGTGTAICPDCTRAGHGRSPNPRIIRVDLDELWPT